MVVPEATKRLEQQGLVEIQHGTGIKIVRQLHRPLSDSLSLLIPDLSNRLRQLHEPRLLIESAAAALAAEKASAAQSHPVRVMELANPPGPNPAIHPIIRNPHAS
jgi:GntR family transcriptional repressor for pyruvate dehydrogenase complex